MNQSCNNLHFTVPPPTQKKRFLFVWRWVQTSNHRSTRKNLVFPPGQTYNIVLLFPGPVRKNFCSPARPAKFVFLPGLVRPVFLRTSRMPARAPCPFNTPDSHMHTWRHKYSVCFYMSHKKQCNSLLVIVVYVFFLI